MLFKRSYQKEIMDDFSIKDERIDRALKELKIINKYLGGNSVSKKGIRIFKNKNEDLTVLDIGGGASDVLRGIVLPENFVTLDLNFRACEYIKNSSRKSEVVCGDALDLPIKKNSFDLIHASLFIHHLTENQIEELFKNLISIAKEGIIINDLRRSVFALAGIKILTSIFSKSKMVKHDAPVSVKRGFTKIELVKIMKSLSIRNYSLQRKWAFRWLLIIEK